MMIKEGDFITALDQLLLRGYISLEKLDTDSSKAQFRELLCKLLRLIYTCLKLEPTYLEELVKGQSEIKIDLSSLLN